MTQPASHDRGISISKGRFEAFSDGVFAIAITLLVLAFHPPEISRVSNATMTHALIGLWPQYVVYAASFATIGIMWFNHYALFHHPRHISYSALIANLALLLFVAFLPFPTLVLARYALVPAAVAYYALTLLCIAICYNVLWYVVTLPHGETGSFGDFVRTRTPWNTAGALTYLVSAVLAFWSPLVSIALIALMAVYYMLPWSVRFVLQTTAVAHAGESE